MGLLAYRLLNRLLNLPDKLRRMVRKKLILAQMQHVGKDFVFDPMDAYSAQGMYVGDNVFVAHGALIISNAEGSVRLENGVMIGPNVTIMNGDHDFRVVGRRTREVTEPGPQLKIVLEEDVWCGANVTILKGVTIGEGAVVGAGSLVARNLPPYTVCVGNPCHPKALRFTDSELRNHLLAVGHDVPSAEGLIQRRSEMTQGLSGANQRSGLAGDVRSG